MARKIRDKSALGIYHVMLRGINKQDIFFNEDEFLHVMRYIQGVQYKKDRKGLIISSDQCTIYAYCILHNHLHILVKEGELTISEIMQKIAISYAMYYNKKYDRVGPMFQGRFESEAVNDEKYFLTAFCYIARNPVKAMESPTAEAYPYSSWNEFCNHKSNLIKVLKREAIQEILNKCPFDELLKWINEDNKDKCMDMDDFINVRSDKEAWGILSDLSQQSTSEDFRLLDQQTQIFYLLQAIDHGVNISQASRLGTLSRFQVRKAYNKKFGELLTKRSGPDVSGSLEKTNSQHNSSVNAFDDKAPESLHQAIRKIPALGRQIYHRLHLIVEYLYTHGDCKCIDVADALNVSSESIRKALMLLSNENIVEIIGNGKNRIYKLSTPWIGSLEND